MRYLIVLAIFFIGFPTISMAERRENWDCYILDANNLVWKATSTYKRQAINKVKDFCKKSSTKPESCIRKQVQCESTFKGFTFAPLWRCTAIDRTGAGFNGNTYENRDRAAIQARNKCRLESSLPETCYTNTITCNNLNQRF